jgi:hypothetical protein
LVECKWYKRFSWPLCRYYIWRWKTQCVICDHHVNIAHWILSIRFHLWPMVCITLIQFCFCDPNASSVKVLFISMENNYRKYEYCIFCIDGFLCF